MKFDDFLFEVENPQIYTGREINVVRNRFQKDNVNVCLVFPDNYAIGMSHLGLKVIYHLLNQMPHVNAERCFVPDPETIRRFAAFKQPLVSIENHVPIKQFDLIAFSILSELNYTNVLATLELAGIPLSRSKRENGEYPLIAAGGISIINPEPLRTFIDFFGIGDGEALFPEIIPIFQQNKKAGNTREIILKQLDTIAGVYVPVLHPTKATAPFYRPGLQIGHIRKRTVRSLERIPLKNGMIVPLSPTVFERLDIELARGCPQNCRFCQAKSYYAPFRYLPVENNLEFIRKQLEGTGFESLSLSALSAGDYPHITNLMNALSLTLPSCVDVSFPSLRPSTLSTQMLEAVARTRKTGITVVPEAGSQRLRRVINKHVTDEEIFSAVDRTIENGWQKVKLYFMIGLPGETDHDIREMIDLLRELAQRASGDRRRPISIHVAISSFVPKPHTPFQWAARESLPSLQEKQKLILSQLKGKKALRFNFNPPERGVVETILARGDTRVADLLRRALAAGERFTAWDNHFNWNIWRDLISELTLDPFLEAFDPDLPLPWDFIDVNYTPAHLKKEYQRARNEELSSPCHDISCRACNGCNYPKENTPSRELSPVQQNKPAQPPSLYRRIRLFYIKDKRLRFFSHLTLVKYIERLIRKAGLRFQCTEGFHPRMKISTPAPLPVYARGLEEVFEFFIGNPEEEEAILEKMQAVSPDLPFIRAWLCDDRPALARDIESVEYTLRTVPGIGSWDTIRDHLGSRDHMGREKDLLRFTIDAADNGIQRFASIYRVLDPRKRYVRELTRTRINFKHD